MIVPFLDLKRVNAPIGDELDECIRNVVRSGKYIHGENVMAFEEVIGRYLGIEHVITVASGTDALHLAIVAAGIGPGHEVLTTPYAFAATLEAIEHAGARPVLVDIDPDTFNIDPDRMDDAVTSKTRGIVPVHMFGLPADMHRIMNIAERHGLVVVEDCAHSLGAQINHAATGSFGAAGAFSFYPTKSLGCFGDGGMVSTNDPAMLGKLRELRNHGDDGSGEHVRLGFNSRLDEIQAAVLRVKLPHLDEMNSRRRQIAAYYNETLADTAAQVQACGDETHHIYSYYTIGVRNRDAVRERLGRAGIGTAIYYAKPLHRHPHYAGSCTYGDLSNAEEFCRRCLSLPNFPGMSDAEVEYVASTTVGAIA